MGFPSSEIFPKQDKLFGADDVGSWINLPYFNAEKTDRYAISRDGSPLSLEEFLEEAEAMQVNEEDLSLIEAVTTSPVDLEGAPPCITVLVKSPVGKGMRNRMLFNLGVFAKLKRSNDWSRFLEELNKHLLDPPLPTGEVNTILQSLHRKQYDYTCREAPMRDACNRAMCSQAAHGKKESKDDPGVAIDRLVKILTDPPTWIITVDGEKMILPTTDDLLIQPRFQRCCVERLNVLSRQISRGAWENLVTNLLERVEEVIAPMDAGREGQFFRLVEEFCQDSDMASKEDLLMGRPWLDKGQVYFNSGDLLDFLSRRKFQLSPREAWVFLKNRGAEQDRFFLKGRTVRVWQIEDPGRQTESFSDSVSGDDAVF